MSESPEKLYWLKFVKADWLTDPGLSQCGPAARGVWIDLLCLIHSDGSGTVTGTYQSLARACRCTDAEMRAALAELGGTGTADIADRNGLVSVTSRRLARESAARASAAKRAAKYRAGRNVGRPNAATAAALRRAGVRVPAVVDELAAVPGLTPGLVNAARDAAERESAGDPAALTVAKLRRGLPEPRDAAEFVRWFKAGTVSGHRGRSLAGTPAESIGCNAAGVVDRATGQVLIPAGEFAQ